MPVLKKYTKISCIRMIYPSNSLYISKSWRVCLIFSNSFWNKYILACPLCWVCWVWYLRSSLHMVTIKTDLLETESARLMESTVSGSSPRRYSFYLIARWLSHCLLSENWSRRNWKRQQNSPWTGSSLIVLWRGGLQFP